MNDWLMILTACSVALPGSLLGVLLVSRNLVMVGDAISHAVLPGIVVAYLLSGSRDSYPMLMGAAVAGLFTTFFIEFLRKKIQIQQDAAIGFSFTLLFALGVLLIALFGGPNSELDQECVLYGDLETSILDQIIVGEYVLGTRAIAQLFPIFVLVLIALIAGFKGWIVWAFNVGFGLQLGLPMRLFHLGLMALLSVYSVLSFESVGVILVVGLLVLPAASARILTNSFKRSFFLSALIGLLSCVGGVYLGKWLNCSISPLIVCVNGVLFIGAVLFRRVFPRVQFKY